MWPLILPPVIVVIALGCILWYLAVRGSDPSLRQAAETLAEAPRLKVRIKAFFVRSSERMVSRSRIAFLRMHNALTGLAQRLRERRILYAKVLQERTKKTPPILPFGGTANVATPASEEGGESAPAPRREGARIAPEFPSGRKASERLAKATWGAFNVLTPLRREHKEADSYEGHAALPQYSLAEQQEASTEPTNGVGVSTSDVTVAFSNGVVPTSDMTAREESLIALIADNPKDHNAYEALGDHYMEAGNVQDAKECYRQVLKLSPAHRGVKMKIRRLEKILAQRRP